MDDENYYRSWKEFNQSEYRRCSTFQLSIDTLEKDLYLDNRYEKKEHLEEEELNFDY